MTVPAFDPSGLREPPAPTGDAAIVEYLLRLADDRLVLGHRLSEWCGHGPILEEDIALANIALDLVGQANLLLGLAGKLEGAGRDADALAYFRDAVQYRNHPLTELPNGDYAFTMVRLFLLAAQQYVVTGSLRTSKLGELAGIAAKAHKESTYHVRHSGEWVVRFGDGTDESRERVGRALEEAWRWTGALWLADEVDRALVERGVGPDLAALETEWRKLVDEVLRRAALTLPEGTPSAARGYRRGDQTEHLGHMLSEMQSLARAHPGVEW